MIDVQNYLPGKRKQTPSGWISFNAVCCQHRGHKADTRSRGGIKFSSSSDWSYHCFNCGFKTGFTLGRSISQKTRLLLAYIGLDKEEIDR